MGTASAPLFACPPGPLQQFHSRYSAASIATKGRWSRTSPYPERCSSWRERKGSTLIVKSDRSRWKQRLGCSQKQCLAHQLPRHPTRTFLTCRPVIIKHQNFCPILQLPVAATVPHSSPATSHDTSCMRLAFLRHLPTSPKNIPAVCRYPLHLFNMPT